jgi:hypothetical protein
VSNKLVVEQKGFLPPIINSESYLAFWRQKESVYAGFNL